MVFLLGCFQEKWTPVFRPKTRQIQGLEPGFDSIKTEKTLGHELINVVKNGMSQSVRIREAKVQEMWCIFKPLRRCSRTDRPYPPDAETASICSVEALEKGTTLVCTLLLASFCRF